MLFANVVATVVTAMENTKMVAVKVASEVAAALATVVVVVIAMGAAKVASKLALTVAAAVVDVVTQAAFAVLTTLLASAVVVSSYSYCCENCSCCLKGLSNKTKHFCNVRILQ